MQHAQWILPYLSSFLLAEVMRGILATMDTSIRPRRVYARTLLKRHYLALILAMAVGLVYVSPHAFISGILADDKGVSYYPVTFQTSYDEAVAYGPRAKAVMEGDLLVGDISLDEYGRGGPAILSILNPLIMGGLGSLLGSFERAIMVADFLFPLLIFLALYALVFEVVRSRKVALAAALVFIFIPDINNYLQLPTLTALSDIFSRFFPFLNSDTSSLYFSKFEYPQITFLFYLAALYTLARSLLRNERYTHWFCGLAFGLLFYTYFYDWVYVGITLVLLALWFLLRREFSELKKIAIIIGTGLVVSMGYWINFFWLASLPGYSDLMTRVGLEISHAPRISLWTNYLRTLLLGGLVLVVAYRYAKTTVFYLIALLLPSVVVFNLQIITGFNPQPDHWFRMQFLPMALGELYLLYVLAQKYARDFFSKKVAMWFLIGVIGTMLSGGLYATYAFSIARASNFSVDRELLEGFLWLDEHTPKGSVVGALSLPFNSAILLHTHNQVFLPFGLNTYAENSEVWNRLMLLSSLYGVTPAEFEAWLQGVKSGSKEKDYNSYLFHNTYADTSLDAYNGYVNNKLKREIPPELQHDTLARYRVYYNNRATVADTMPYRLDYLVVLVGSEFEVRDRLREQPVFQNKTLRIYAR